MSILFPHVEGCHACVTLLSCSLSCWCGEAAGPPHLLWLLLIPFQGHVNVCQQRLLLLSQAALTIKDRGLEAEGENVFCALNLTGSSLPLLHNHPFASCPLPDLRALLPSDCNSRQRRLLDKLLK